MLRQYIKIRFSGVSPERFLNMCKHKQIKIWDLEFTDEFYECCMFAKDFKRIKTIVRKTKIKIHILEKHGIGFIMFQYRKRFCFFIGIICCSILFLFMTERIWSIEINGNFSYTKDVLYDYLNSNRIMWGINRADIDCEEICKMLRRDFQDIIWVSSSLEGTKLKIDIKEKSDTIESYADDESYQDIESDIEGTITKIITRKGVPLVKEGDKIAVGDLLVSGRVPILDDAGMMVREEFVCADADVYVRSTINFQASCKNTYLQKNYLKTKKYIISLQILSYHIDLGMHKKGEYQEIRGYYRSIVPFVTIGRKMSRVYECIESKYSEEEQMSILEEQYNRFRAELDNRNIELISQDLRFTKTTDELIYAGNIEVVQQVVDLY